MICRYYFLRCGLLLSAFLQAPLAAAQAATTPAAAAVATPEKKLIPELCVTPAGSLQPGARIHFDSRVFDFGIIQKGAALQHTFVFYNRGTEPLEVTDVRPACGCTTAGEWTRKLAPDGTGSIAIKFDSAQFAGPISKTITVSSNDPAMPQTVLEIKGIIRTPVHVSNPVVIFPAVSDPTQSTTRSVTIRHELEGALTLTDLQCDKPFFKPVLKEVVPGKEFELQVSTVTPLESGTHTARIQMKSSNPDMPIVSVQAVVTVMPPVQIAPTEMSLPSGKLAAPEKRYVVVLNHRAGDLQLSDLQTNARGVEVATQRNADGRQFTITLTFPAGFEAPAAEKLYFRGKTNHASAPTFSVPIVFAAGR